MAKAAGDSGQRLGVTAVSQRVVGVMAGTLAMLVFHPIVGLPIAAGALADLWYGQRRAVALAAALVGGAVAGLLGSATLYVVVVPMVGVTLGPSAVWVFGLMSAASLALVGPGIAELLRTGSAYRAIGLALVGLSVLQVAALALFAAGAGQGLEALVGDAVAEVAALTGGLAEVEASVVAGWPALLVSMNALAAVLSTVVVGRAAARRRIAASQFPRLAVVDLDPRLTVLPIAAIALIAVGRFPVAIAGDLEVAGTNLLIVARWVFFLQGLAVFAGLYERARFPRFTRVLGYLMLGVTEALLPLVSLTGLVDVWLNVRRLPRDGADQKVVEVPPDTH